VGGKTGTSDDENDAWFVGFTNDVTIGVWVGYDNKGKRRTLGGGQTGGRVAVPIFEQIVQATWSMYAKQTPLALPSPEAKKELVALPIDLASGTRITDRRQGAFTEWFRVRNGEIADTQYNMVSQYEVASPEDNYSSGGGYAADGGERGYPYGGNRGYYGSANNNPFASFFGLFAPQQTYAPPQQNYAPQQRQVYPPAARQQQYPSGYTYRGQQRYW
jgi:membrane peptidoglycan carboxypeptidase